MNFVFRIRINCCRCLKVDITINGNSVEDLYMELGAAGEALFLEEDSAVNLPPQRHLEPSDSNIFLDPDNALLTTSQPQLSNIDCSPQIINKQLDEQKAHENHESTPKYAYEQSNSSNIEVDVLTSTTTMNTNNNNNNNSRRRHPMPRRRSTISNMQRQSSEEDVDQEVETICSSMRRRSRAKRRGSTSKSLNENPANQIKDDETQANTAFQRKRSSSENDLQFFPIDDEKQSESSTPFVDAHSRMNSIDSRKKVLFVLPSKSPQLDNDDEDDEEEEEEEEEEDNESYTSSPEDSIQDETTQARTTRTMSNPIPIEIKPVENYQYEDESNSLINTMLSQSAPLTNNNLNTASARISQSNASDSYYLSESFSPTSSFENSSASLRPSSPKSDTEYELDKSSSQQKSKSFTSRIGFGWQWKWGELPERKRSVFQYFWPSSKQQTPPTEGVYLDDIANIDRSKYLPTM